MQGDSCMWISIVPKTIHVTELSLRQSSIIAHTTPPFLSCHALNPSSSSGRVRGLKVSTYLSLLFPFKVGVGWQRYFQVRPSRRQLANQVTILCFACSVSFCGYHYGRQTKSYCAGWRTRLRIWGIVVRRVHVVRHPSGIVYAAASLEVATPGNV